MNKPTKEDLEASLKKTTEDIEKLNSKPLNDIAEDDNQDRETETETETAAAENGEKKDEKDPVAAEVTEEKEETADEEKEEKKTEEAKPEEKKEEKEEKEEEKEDGEKVDWKKRYGDSTKEAHNLYKNNSIMNQAMIEANTLPEPTENELAKEFGDEWSEMTAGQKMIAKDAIWNKRRWQIINEASQKLINSDAWNKKIKSYIADPKTLTDHPEVEGKEDDFLLYCSGKETVGNNMEVLMSAFLHDMNVNRKPKKGQMFPTGSGGANDKNKPKSDKISIEQARILMMTNYKEYKKMLLAGKIDMSGVK